MSLRPLPASTVRSALATKPVACSASVFGGINFFQPVFSFLQRYDLQVPRTESSSAGP